MHHNTKPVRRIKKRKKRKVLTPADIRRKDKSRWYHIRKTYGLTREKWYEIYDEQQGCCFICQRHETKVRSSRSKYLTVDHCHDTGKIRGLLCGNCNMNILPSLRDNAEIAKRIVIYLTKEHNYGIAPEKKH